MDLNSVSVFAIAQNEVDRYLQQQADQVAPEPKRPITQRKARYHDKNRTRRKDVQAWVYRRTGLTVTAQVKAALKKLGKRFDLRLTTAWIDINLSYADAIAALVKTDGINESAIADYPLVEVINESAIADCKFKVGDRVNLLEYGAKIAHWEQWSPFSILELADGIAKLELISSLVPVSQLQLAS